MAVDNRMVLLSSRADNTASQLATTLFDDGGSDAMLIGELAFNTFNGHLLAGGDPDNALASIGGSAGKIVAATDVVGITLSTAATMQEIGTGASPTFVDLTLSGGDIAFGNTQASTLTIADTATDATGKAMTISAGKAATGTDSDIAGGALTFQAGQGKGTGAGGDIVFKTANASTTAATHNSLVTALTISDDLGASFAGDVNISGDLNVTGDTVQLDSTSLVVKDKELYVGVAGGLEEQTFTRASNDTVTIQSVGHGFADGEFVLIVGGGTADGVSDGVYTVAEKTNDTFEIGTDTGADVSTAAAVWHSSANTTDATAGGAGIFVPGASLHSIKFTTSGTQFDISDDISVTGSGAFSTDVTVGDDLSLTSDGAVFNMGDGSDFTITHASTGGTIAGNPVTITSGGAATWSTSSGALTIDSAAALTMDTNGTYAVNLGTEGVAKTITVGADESTKVDVNAIAIELDATTTVTLDSAGTAAGAIDINSAGGVDMDAAGAISLNTTGVAGDIEIHSAHTAGDAILIDANAAAGSILNIDAGIMDVDVQAALSLTTTGVAGDIEIHSAHTAGVAVLIDANAAAGAILDIDAGIMDVDVQGVLTLDAVGVAIGAGSGELDLTTTGTLDVNANALDMDLTDSSAITITSSEAGEDLTISQAGANDSSIIITAAGDGADAVSIDVTAGSMLIAPSLLDTKTLTIGNTASTHMTFTPHGTAGSEKINLSNEAGTAADAIKIHADAGGISLVADSTSHGVSIATGVTGVPISIGHTTSQTTVNDDLAVTGTLTAGVFAPVDLTVTGDTTLGDGITDTIEFVGRIKSATDIIPIADGNSDLGTSALKFQEIFVDTVTAATISGGVF